VAAARRMMKYKNARTLAEIIQSVKAANPAADETTVKKMAKAEADALAERGLLIQQWDLTYLASDLTWCGRSGSPTKVHRIQSVVLTAKESKDIAPTEEGVADMIHELIQDKVIS
jgi:electron transfer flavoprotein beta subunit